MPDDNLVASTSKFAEVGDGAATAIRVVTTTLDDVLDRAGVSRIDFLTIDIELAEPAALKGFSIQRFRPRLVCIEAHPSIRQLILEYFARSGYVTAGKYLRADPANLWFTPLAVESPP